MKKLFSLLIVLIAIVAAVTLLLSRPQIISIINTNAQTATRTANTKIYLLSTDARIKFQVEQILGYMIVPDTVTDEAARHAWSYAVRYSAKTLDVPDYEAAVQLLMERHPSWIAVISTPPALIHYSSAYAEGDIPD